MAEQSSDLGISTILVQPVAGITNRSHRLRPSTDFTAYGREAFPEPIPNFLRPAATGLRSPALSEPRDSAVEARRLIVGKGIALSGEINYCESLFVEGSVEAKLVTCRNLVIAETGNFNGVAVTDNAEVRGHYNGDLVVRNRLSIHATGRVTGTISYRDIEIEPRGKISGDVRDVGDDQRREDRGLRT